MSQKQEVDRLSRMVQKLEATQGRHLDTINRLLGHTLEGGNPSIPIYEHELMHLNEQLALADIRREAFERAFRKLQQSLMDKLATMDDGKMYSYLDGLYQTISEVMSDARPRNLDEGRSAEAGSEAEAAAGPAYHSA